MIPLFTRRRDRRQFVGGISVDGDQVCLVVCDASNGERGGSLCFDRETMPADLATSMREAERLVAIEGGGHIDWVRALGGGDVIHEVMEIPPQVRPFTDVRLEACLAGTSWSNVEAVEAAGSRLGHMFDGDTCVIAVAPAATLGAAAAESPGARLTSSAVSLLELVRAVAPGLFERGAPAALALLCESSRVAACIVEDGEVRLLHQTGLLEYFREFAPESPRPAPPVPDGPLEFEFGGSYAPTGDTGAARRVASDRELYAADVESGVYQASAMKIVQETLTLYREQYGAAAAVPATIHLAGEAAARHALAAFFARYLGSQFAVEELDAAMVVRIDEPDVARRFVALQGLYGAALAAVAAALRPGVLEIAAESASDAAGSGAAVSRLARVGSRALATGLAVAVGLAALACGARYALLARTRSTLESAVAAETERQTQLRALTERRRETEARLAHTRALVAALASLRARQALPPELLETIHANLPPGTRLEEITLEGAVVRISGEADDKENGMLLALALERLDDAFADVTPQTETRVVAERDDETGETVERLSHAFTITAIYTRNAATGAERAAVAPPAKRS